MSGVAVERDGFIDTYAALPVERFDEAADDTKRQYGSGHDGQRQSATPETHTLNTRRMSPTIPTACVVLRCDGCVCVCVRVWPQRC